MSELRTLQFEGYAYGNTPVILNAHINGNVVFSGEVATTDTPVPSPADGLPGTQVLFSVENSSLVPSDFAGALPMTISVANGYGVLVGNIMCNYMSTVAPGVTAVMADSTVDGTTLTVGSLSSGTIKTGMALTGTGVADNTTIVSGSGLTWTINNSQTVATTTITGIDYIAIPGNATGFLRCFTGTPTNSEGTPDPRSSVTIDDVTQVPPQTKSLGIWVWNITPGSTLGYNLNVSLGNVA